MKKIYCVLAVFLLICPVFAGVKEDELYSKFNSTYKMLNSAATCSIAKNGAFYNWDWSKSEDEIFDTYIRPYLDIKKECADNNSECWNVSAFKALNDHAPEAPDGLHKTYILSNGSSLLFESKGKTCMSSPDGKTRSCAFFWIDTNGFAQPNTSGRDFFKFYLFPRATGIYPVGYPYNSIPDVMAIDKSCNLNAQGTYCGAKLLIEGKMAY